MTCDELRDNWFWNTQNGFDFIHYLKYKLRYDDKICDWYQYSATLNFVSNGTNKFSKQVDQSLMNSYLIDGFIYSLQISEQNFQTFIRNFLDKIYFAKQNNNMTLTQWNITKLDLFLYFKTLTRLEWIISLHSIY